MGGIYDLSSKHRVRIFCVTQQLFLLPSHVPLKGLLRDPVRVVGGGGGIEINTFTFPCHRNN